MDGTFGLLLDAAVFLALALALSKALKVIYTRLDSASWVMIVLGISLLTFPLLVIRPLVGYNTIWLSMFAVGVSILFFEDENTSVKKRQIVGAAIMLIVPPIIMGLDYDAHHGVW